MALPALTSTFRKVGNVCKSPQVPLRLPLAMSSRLGHLLFPQRQLQVHQLSIMRTAILTSMAKCNSPSSQRSCPNSRPQLLPLRAMEDMVGRMQPLLLVLMVRRPLQLQCNNRIRLRRR